MYRGPKLQENNEGGVAGECVLGGWVGGDGVIPVCECAGVHYYLTATGGAFRR